MSVLACFQRLQQLSDQAAKAHFNKIVPHATETKAIVDRRGASTPYRLASPYPFNADLLAVLQGRPLQATANEQFHLNCSEAVLVAVLQAHEPTCRSKGSGVCCMLKQDLLIRGLKSPLSDQNIDEYNFLAPFRVNTPLRTGRLDEKQFAVYLNNLKFHKSERIPGTAIVVVWLYNIETGKCELGHCAILEEATADVILPDRMAVHNVGGLRRDQPDGYKRHSLKTVLQICPTEGSDQRIIEFYNLDAVNTTAECTKWLNDSFKEYRKTVAASNESAEWKKAALEDTAAQRKWLQDDFKHRLKAAEEYGLVHWDPTSRFGGESRNLGQQRGQLLALRSRLLKAAKRYRLLKVANQLQS